MNNKKLTIHLTVISTVILAIWAWSYSLNTATANYLPWITYDNILFVTGLMAMALLSITMILATRPAFLEPVFNGLDKIYRLHKWTAILAVIFAVLHWLIEMNDDWLESLLSAYGQPVEAPVSGFVDNMQELAEDLGEWSFYLVAAMVLISLLKFFPYKFWRYLHRIMPILYLLLVFHAAWLTPFSWWQQPIGLLLALLMVAGGIAAIRSLTGQLGRTRRVQGIIQSISTNTQGITQVVCQMDKKWPGHRAGQFAFVSFNRLEGAHPFTIANADNNQGQLTFEIKALGDYTKNLAQKLSTGQAVTVEGPYGRFDFKHRKANAEQIWVAAGIGVTPFLAWLEELQNNPELVPNAQMHYCTNDGNTDPMVTRLQQLCENLPGISLHIHDSQKGQKITPKALLNQQPSKKTTEVWYCGPKGLAKLLETGLKQIAPGSLRFRKEAFELR
ncbi:MAG: ferric reductase [Proteobacteria bacterium]|nr:MAG: ferric reductase [Pseudomonadota bacterium]